MSKLEKIERNRFIISEIQKNPGKSRRKIARDVAEKFGGDEISPQRVKQIWDSYMGKYNVKITYELTPKK